MKFQYTYRKKRKVSNKTICKGMGEDLEGGDMEAIFIDMIGNNSSTWNNSMQHSINTCVCPSNYASDHEKGIRSFDIKLFYHISHERIFIGTSK